VGDHVLGQVDADHPSGRADPLRGPQKYGASTAPHVEPPLAHHWNRLLEQCSGNGLKEVDSDAVVSVGHEIEERLYPLNLLRCLGHGASVARNDKRR
jgi:hypothetical protein